MFLRRLLCIWIVISFVATLIIPPQRAYAQTVLNLPEPGSMVSLSSAYTPVLIKGLKINPKNPLSLDFIVATGDSKLTAKDPELKKESEKLIKYFFAALTLPEKDVWVNLSPYEKDRIIPKATGDTEMGRDMLAQDYILKQITASLIYPEKGLGKEFWNKVYAEASERFGTTQIPVNTFNKVWIVADRASVYEAKDTVFVVDSHLKVMLDEDYIALQKHGVIASEAKQSFNSNDTHALGSQIVREIVLPALEKEVNEGKNFANLRQIFHSLILAKWYKETLKSALLNQVYSNKNKVGGLSFPSASVGNPQYIYQQYLKAYKKGVFNYIKEDIDQATNQRMPRKYFSGGITSAAMTVTLASASHAMSILQGLAGDHLLMVGVVATIAAAVVAIPQIVKIEKVAASRASSKRKEREAQQRMKKRRRAFEEDAAMTVKGGDVYFSNGWVSSTEQVVDILKEMTIILDRSPRSTEFKFRYDRHEIKLMQGISLEFNKQGVTSQVIGAENTFVIPAEQRPESFKVLENISRFITSDSAMTAQEIGQRFIDNILPEIRAGQAAEVVIKPDATKEQEDQIIADLRMLYDVQIAPVTFVLNEFQFKKWYKDVIAFLPTIKSQEAANADIAAMENNIVGHPLRVLILRDKNGGRLSFTEEDTKAIDGAVRIGPATHLEQVKKLIRASIGVKRADPLNKMHMADSPRSSETEMGILRESVMTQLPTDTAMIASRQVNMEELETLNFNGEPVEVSFERDGNIKIGKFQYRRYGLGTISSVWRYGDLFILISGRKKRFEGFPEGQFLIWSENAGNFRAISYSEIKNYLQFETKIDDFHKKFGPVSENDGLIGNVSSYTVTKDRLDIKTFSGGGISINLKDLLGYFSDKRKEYILKPNESTPRFIFTANSMSRTFIIKYKSGYVRTVIVRKLDAQDSSYLVVPAEKDKNNTEPSDDFLQKGWQESKPSDWKMISIQNSLLNIGGIALLPTKTGGFYFFNQEKDTALKVLPKDIVYKDAAMINGMGGLTTADLDFVVWEIQKEKVLFKGKNAEAVQRALGIMEENLRRARDWDSLSKVIPLSLKALEDQSQRDDFESIFVSQGPLRKAVRDAIDPSRTQSIARAAVSWVDEMSHTQSITSQRVDGLKTLLAIAHGMNGQTDVVEILIALRHFGDLAMATKASSQIGEQGMSEKKKTFKGTDFLVGILEHLGDVQKEGANTIKFKLTKNLSPYAAILEDKFKDDQLWGNGEGDKQIWVEKLADEFIIHSLGNDVDYDVIVKVLGFFKIKVIDPYLADLKKNIERQLELLDKSGERYPITKISLSIVSMNILRKKADFQLHPHFSHEGFDLTKTSVTYKFRVDPGYEDVLFDDLEKMVSSQFFHGKDFFAGKDWQDLRKQYSPSSDAAMNAQEVSSKVYNRLLQYYGNSSKPFDWVTVYDLMHESPRETEIKKQKKKAQGVMLDLELEGKAVEVDEDNWRLTNAAMVVGAGAQKAMDAIDHFVTGLEEANRPVVDQEQTQLKTDLAVLNGIRKGAMQESVSEVPQQVVSLAKRINHLLLNPTASELHVNIREAEIMGEILRTHGDKKSMIVSLNKAGEGWVLVADGYEGWGKNVQVELKINGEIKRSELLDRSFFLTAVDRGNMALVLEEMGVKVDAAMANSSRRVVYSGTKQIKGFLRSQQWLSGSNIFYQASPQAAELPIDTPTLKDMVMNFKEGERWELVVLKSNSHNATSNYSARLVRLDKAANAAMIAGDGGLTAMVEIDRFIAGIETSRSPITDQEKAQLYMDLAVLDGMRNGTEHVLVRETPKDVIILANRINLLLSKNVRHVPIYAAANADRAALAQPKGGIDLNASKLNLQRQGSGIQIKFDPAMIERFKMGDFNGIVPVITGITPIANIYPLLGLKEPEEISKAAV